MNWLKEPRLQKVQAGKKFFSDICITIRTQLPLPIAHCAICGVFVYVTVLTSVRAASLGVLGPDDEQKDANV
jgi:hypothetical protein